MPITIDPAAKRLILDSASVTAKDIFRAWADWMLLSDNAKYLPAFSATGGDDLGGGLSIPPYYFLLNGWRVRPMESSHDLTITGNLFVDGGGVPVVNTLGTFQVNVNYTVPVQAQGIATSGSSGPTVGEITDAIFADAAWAALALKMAEMWKLHGLESNNPLVVSPTGRTTSDITQTVATVGSITTVQRA